MAKPAQGGGLVDGASLSTPQRSCQAVGLKASDQDCFPRISPSWNMGGIMAPAGPPSPTFCCSAGLQLPTGRRIVSSRARFPSVAGRPASWRLFS